jgi:hypothetical protein
MKGFLILMQTKQPRLDLLAARFPSPLPAMNLTLVGTSRCDVPARQRSEGGTQAKTRVLAIRLRRLTLRSATGTAQRAIPTGFRGINREPWQLVESPQRERVRVRGDGAHSRSSSFSPAKQFFKETHEH